MFYCIIFPFLLRELTHYPLETNKDDIIKNQIKISVK